jgi:hypothetical protein
MFTTSIDRTAHRRETLKYIKNNYSQEFHNEAMYRMAYIETLMTNAKGALLLLFEMHDGERPRYYLGGINTNEGHFQFRDEDFPAPVCFPVESPSFFHTTMGGPDRDPGRLIGECGFVGYNDRWDFNVMAYENRKDNILSRINDRKTQVIIGEEQIVKFGQSINAGPIIDQMIWFVTKDDE